MKGKRIPKSMWAQESTKDADTGSASSRRVCLRGLDFGMRLPFMGNSFQRSEQQQSGGKMVRGTVRMWKPGG